MPTKSIAEKLLVKPNTTVWASHPGRAALIGPFPEGVRMASSAHEASTAVVFADSANDLRQVLDANKDGLAAPAVFWVAYPKANKADINRDTLWPILAEYGMRPIGQVAIDDSWSALRFRTLKPGETFKPGG